MTPLPYTLCLIVIALCGIAGDVLLYRAIQAQRRRLEKLELDRIVPSIGMGPVPRGDTFLQGLGMDADCAEGALNFAGTLGINPEDVLVVSVYPDTNRTGHSQERAMIRFLSGEVIEVDPNAAKALIKTLPEHKPEVGNNPS